MIDSCVVRITDPCGIRLMRKTDSMYRRKNRRQGFADETAWEEGESTWKLITDGAMIVETGAERIIKFTTLMVMSRFG